MISYLIIFFSLIIIITPKNKEIKGDLFYSIIFFSISFSQAIIGFISLILISFGISKFPILIIASLIFFLTYLKNKRPIKYLNKIKIFIFNEFKEIIKEKENSNYQKIVFTICILLTIAILISSIGPINHPDAADYHVGYPFQYFIRGKFFIDGGLHQGLLGIGDYANLSFIQENSIWLIRLFQIINLPLLVIFLSKKFNNNTYLLIFLSIPTIIQWSTIGKPLFLGESSLIAIYLIWKQNKNLFTLKLLLISIINCISFKISSLLVITPLILNIGFYFYKNYKFNKDKLKFFKEILKSRVFILATLILGTLLFNRYLITGNFAYPLLTNIFNKGDELIISFSNFIKNYQRQDLFIMRIFIPTKLSNIGESLGLSTLFIILGIFYSTTKNKKTRNDDLFYISISQLLLLFLFCQGRSDYYLIPLILILYQNKKFEVLIERSILKYPFYLTVFFQFILINIFLSISIFYNLQAIYSYENLMKTTAYGFNNALLIDKSLPGKVFIKDRNTRLYYSFNYLDKDKLNRCIKQKNSDIEGNGEEICLKENNVTQIIAPKNSESYKNLYSCKFINTIKATRNLLKRKPYIVNYCKIKNLK